MLKYLAGYVEIFGSVTEKGYVHAVNGYKDLILRNCF